MLTQGIRKGWVQQPGLFPEAHPRGYGLGPKEAAQAWACFQGGAGGWKWMVSRASARCSGLGPEAPKALGRREGHSGAQLASWAKRGQCQASSTNSDPEIPSFSHSPADSSSCGCPGQEPRLGMRPAPWDSPRCAENRALGLPHPCSQGASPVTMTLSHLGFKQTFSRGAWESPLCPARGQPSGVCLWCCREES